IPFSNIASRRTRGVDLREVGSGTVSGTALYRVAGFTPLAVAGVLDVSKGAVGPLLAGRRRPLLAAVAGGAAVVGHNWSPWLRGAGGRGIAPAFGSLLATAPTGVPVLAAGLVAGRLARRPGLGSFGALGDWMGTIALMVLVSQETGSSTAVGGILVLRLIPAAVAGPLAARLAQRWDRRRTMLTMDLVRAGIVAVVPLVSALWWAYLWAFMLELASLAFLPARDASIPE